MTIKICDDCGKAVNREGLNTEEEIEALWARVNFIFDRLIEKKIIGEKKANAQAQQVKERE